MEPQKICDYAETVISAQMLWSQQLEILNILKVTIAKRKWLNQKVLQMT